MAGRVEGTQPSHSLESFGGEYEHPAYGVLRISSNDGRLQLAYHGITTQLDHFHYDVFMADGGLANLKARFATGLDGAVESLSLPLQSSVKDIVFVRTNFRRG